MAIGPHSVIAQRYQLLDVVGQGGMGIVYRAQDRLTGQQVALKQVLVEEVQLAFAAKAQTQDGDKLRLSLAQEFRILAALRHPYIVSVLDYGFDAQRQPFFVMTLVEAALNLTDYARGKTDAEKTHLLVQLLQALHYLHRRGIIHHDLKPDNVLVTPDGTLKVMDFGLALAQRNIDAAHADEDDQVAGTFAYMAPEILQGAPPSIQADLWAVGVMAYELLVGEHPFVSDQFQAMLMNILVQPLPTIALDTPLRTWVERLLDRDVETRYPSAQHALEALSQVDDSASSAESQAVRESFLQASDFVGRAAELEQLQVGLARMMDGAVTFYLLGGEAGVGKTRLVEELRTTALVDGVQVLRGQGRNDGGLPFQLWRAVLRQLLLHIELSDLEAGVLKALVPDIDALLGREVSAAPALTGKAQQDRLVLTIVDCCKRVVQPILIVLEDLQWAQESLLPLKQMLRVPEQMAHVMVIGTFRNDERPRLPDELPGCELLLLQRLSRETMAELSAAMLGSAGQNPQLLDLLATQTEGNTFFIVEVVRALAEEAGRLSDIGRITLPRQILTGGIQAVLERRLVQIAAADRPALRLAAIIGRQIDERLLAHLQPDLALDAWLYRAEAAAVLTVQDESWQFTHDKLREAALANASTDQRALLHRLVAGAIEVVYADDADYHEALLDHWQQGADQAKALHYLELVAQTLIENRAAYDAARARLERGLAELPADDPRCIPLWNLLAQAHERQGHYDDVVHYADLAHNLATQLGDQRGLANSLNQLGAAAIGQGDNETARAHYQASLAIRQTLGNQRDVASSLNNLGVVAYYQGQLAQARDYYEQSLAVGQAIGDQLGIITRQNNLASVAYGQGDYDQARAYLEESLRIGEAIGDRRGIALTLGNLGAVAYYREDYERAQTYFQQALGIQQALGEQQAVAGSLGNLGMAAYHLEQHAQALDYLEQCLFIQRTIGDQYGIAYSLTNMGYVYVRQGESNAATHSFQRALRIAREIGVTAIMLDSVVGLAWLEHEAGNTARAVELTAMVQLHRASNSDVQRRLGELLPLFNEALSDDARQAATERGAALNFDTLVTDLLAM